MAEKVTQTRPQKSHNAAGGSKLPHSLEAEQSLLGGLLIDREAINKIAGALVPEDFYRDVHGTIFRAILDLYEKDTAIDLVTINTALNDRGQLASVGGTAYLSALVDTMPSSSSIETYAGIIKEKSIMRSVMDAAGKIQAMGFEEQEMAAKEYLDRAEMLIFSIEGERERKKARKVYDVLLEGVPKIERLWKNQSQITGVPTGFEKLDLLTAGFQPSDLIVIAGRPSMGKTSIALNMAQTAAVNNVPVGIFSLEMSVEQLSMKFLATESGISFTRIRTGAIDENEWGRLSETTFKFEELPLFIDDTAGLNILDLRGRARRMVKEHGVGIIFIDYLQLIRGRRENDKREQEISEISRFLKALAKELNIPVIALSQLNRKVEERHDKRPQLADLRESGAIEQDADVILLLYRDEVYNPDPESPEAGKAEVNIGKQRNGPVGTVKLGYQNDCTRFYNLYGQDGDDIEDNGRESSQRDEADPGEDMYRKVATAGRKPAGNKDNDFVPEEDDLPDF